MRKNNPFIAQSCINLGLGFPEISVYLEEQYGQCAEDVIVCALIRAYCQKNNIESFTLKYCEIGGNHPVATSASYLLHKQLGLTGVIVEANPQLIPELHKARPHDKIINCAVIDTDLEKIDFFIGNRNELSSIESRFLETWPAEGGGIREKIIVDCIRLDQLLLQEFSDQAPIFLSLDIEGADYRILKTIALEGLRPYIIQIEPSDHYISTNSQDISSFLGAKGYTLVAKTPVNLIFIDLRNELMP